MATKATLLSLPDEVIRMMFDHFATKTRELERCTRICRRLRPLEALLYKEIQRTSISEHWFLQLARTLASRPELRQLVRTLSVPGQPRLVQLRVKGKMCDYGGCNLCAAEYLLAILPLPACTSLALQSFQLDMLDALISEPSVPT